MAITYDQLPGPKGLPLIGLAHKVKINDLHNQVQQWAQEYGGVYKLKLGPSNLTVVTKPEIIQEILRLRPDEFIRMAKMDRVIREQGFHGVFNAEGDDWRMHRSMVAKGLDVRHQQQFFPHMEKCIERLYRKWERDAENGNIVDIQQDFLRFTVDVTTYLAFGYEMNTIEEKGGVIQDHLEKIFPRIFKRINDPIPFYKLFRTQGDKEFDHAVAEIKKVLDEFVANGKQRLQDNPELRENPENVLEAILVAAEEEENFGDEEVKGNLMTLLLAGEDTTAHTLAWAIYLLADNQQLIPEMRKEIDAILGDEPWVKEYKDQSKLKYVEGVANETLRLNPVAPLMLNEPTEDIEIDGYLFKKGARLLLQTRWGATNPGYFTDPEEFNPGRWIAASRCPVHNTDAFVPFGSGPRYCPGRNLALLEMKLVLSMLFKNFDVEMLTNREEVHEIMAFTMMASEYKVKLTKRN